MQIRRLRERNVETGLSGSGAEGYNHRLTAFLSPPLVSGLIGTERGGAWWRTAKHTGFNSRVRR